MRRACVLIILGGLAGAAGLARALPAAAQADRVRFSPTDRVEDAVPEGTDFVAPSGAKTILIIVDYKGASRTKINTELNAQGGLSLFQKSDTVSGDGSAIVAISGAQILQRVSFDLVDTADAIVADAERAADPNRATGNLGYLGEAYNKIEALRVATDFLSRMQLDNDMRSFHDDLDEAVQALEALEARRGEVGTSLDRIRAAAADVAAQAKLAKAAAEKLNARADTLDAKQMPIPDSGTGRSAPYDVAIKVGTYPALDAEFWVTSDNLPVASATPTSASRATAGSATPAPGGAGATASATRPTGGSGSGGDQRSAATSQPPGAGPRPTPANGASKRMTDAALGAAAGTPILPPGGGETAPAGDVASDPASQPTMEPLATTPEPVAPEPVVVPTWTLPAAAVAALADQEAGSEGGADGQRATQPASSAGGPNLAVLGIGLMALIAVAVWLRRRV